MEQEIKIKDYDKDAHIIMIGLSLCGFAVTYDFAYLLSEFIKLYNKKGGKLTIDDACDLKFDIDHKLDIIRKQYIGNK